MAFILNNFYPVSSKLSSTEGNLWMYTTAEDNSTTVTASGYFNNIVQLISLNDLIVSECSDGVFFIKITSQKNITPVTSNYFSDPVPSFKKFNLIPVTAPSPGPVSVDPTKNNCYYSYGTDLQVIFNLPTNFSLGDQFLVINQITYTTTPASFEIDQQNSGQQIINGLSHTTLGFAGGVATSVSGTSMLITCISNDSTIFYLTPIFSCGDTDRGNALQFF